MKKAKKANCHGVLIHDGRFVRAGEIEKALPGACVAVKASGGKLVKAPGIYAGGKNALPSET